MIDLHSHILPGLDDGPEELDGSIAIAREAAANGVTAIAATPHVRDDFPTTSHSMMAAVAQLRGALRDARIDVDLLPGAEVAFDRLRHLGLDELRSFGLGGSAQYLLVELPFFGWPLDIADQVSSLREAGFTTVLAHPERNLALQESPARLVDLVRSGVLVQATAGSLVGNFGTSASRTAKQLVESGLVHLLATDTHKAGGSRSAFSGVVTAIGDPALMHWLTTDVPAAIVAGTRLPDRPSAALSWRRVGRRRSST